MSPPAPRPSILVVDDDEPLLDTIAAILCDDFDVVTCTSGEKAIVKFDPERFAIVIADYQMPGMSGLQLLQRLMARSSTTSYLLMTAAADFYATAPTAGQRPPVIFKPFQPEAFQNTVAHLLRIAEMKRSTRALQAMLPPEPRSGSGRETKDQEEGAARGPAGARPTRGRPQGE
jgi:DNA-binding NtrC family response regulator